MANGARMNARRIAQQIADEIQIMDRMQQDLDPWQIGKKRPKMPRRIKRQPGIEINDIAKQALGYGILDRQ